MLMQLVITGILIGGIYAVISIGLSLIFGVMRIINFAHGEFLMFGMYGSFWMFYLLGVHPYMSILIVAPIAFVVGVLIYKAVIQPSMKKGTTVVVLVTVGLSVLMQNLALFLWKSDFRTMDIAIASKNIQIGSIFIPLASLVAFTAATIVTVVLWLFLNNSHMGRAIRATAQNKQTSQLMGINVEKTFLITFGLGSVLVTVGASLISPILAVFPSIGVNMVMVCFVIVVLGGLGSIPGAWVGGVIIGLIDALAGFYFSSEVKQIIFFALFISIMVFMPAGLFGVKGSQEVGMK